MVYCGEKGGSGYCYNIGNIRSMWVSELPLICMLRYGHEKRKCWSQIALAPMWGKGLSDSPVVVKILSQKLLPLPSFWGLEETFSRLLFVL